MTPSESLDRFEQGAMLPRQAIDGLSRADLLAFPVPGTWSIQQVVLHLMDSDLIGTERMKRVIAEERPLLLGYNETLFTKNLFYEQMDAGLACEIFESNRMMTAHLLRSLPGDAWERSGIHSERGIETLEHLVRGYADHLDHHLKFISAKRIALGKPRAA